MKVADIISDESYPHHKSLTNVLKRIRDIHTYIVEETFDDKISFKIRDMEFIRVEPLDDCVKVTTEFYYERIVDLANKYDVEVGKGRNGTDIISYRITSPLSVQYAISLAQQSFTRFKRLIL